MENRQATLEAAKDIQQLIDRNMELMESEQSDTFKRIVDLYQRLEGISKITSTSIRNRN